MITFAIIPGGGDSPLSWGPAIAQLRELGHDAIAVDLPVEDPRASWPEYAAAVVAAISGKRDVVVVGYSLGGFTAPLVCEHIPVRQIVLACAMIPTPGARFGSYWSDSGYTGVSFDDEAFFHDLSPEARDLANRATRDQQDLSDPWPLAAWPRVPTRFLLGRDDRILPAPRTRQLVRERLGIEADEMDGGHCLYLSRPREFAERLHAYVTAP